MNKYDQGWRQVNMPRRFRRDPDPKVVLICCAAMVGFLNWNVPITWVEFRDDEKKYALVDFDTASRNGEPFEALIRKRNYLPNPVTRFCTIELKIRPMARHLLSLGFGENMSECENMSMIGIRADEQRRAAKIEDKSRVPLVPAGVTKEIVGDFWRNQSFDLKLPNMNGTTMHGNCDLCFLKGGASGIQPDRGEAGTRCLVGQDGSVSVSVKA